MPMTKLNEHELRSFLKNFLYKKLDRANLSHKDLTDDVNFVTSGIIDSMGFFELMGDIEDKFNVELDFSEKDPKEFTTIEELVDLIQSQP